MRKSGQRAVRKIFEPQVRKKGRFLLILVLKKLIFQRKILIEEAKWKVSTPPVTKRTVDPRG